MKGRVALGFVAAGLLGACASVDPSAPVDAPTVYRARCALCHPPWSPTDFSPSEWPVYVKKYAPRAGLSPAERVAVTDYLVRESRKR